MRPLYAPGGEKPRVQTCDPFLTQTHHRLVPGCSISRGGSTDDRIRQNVRFIDIARGLPFCPSSPGKISKTSPEDVTAISKTDSQYSSKDGGGTLRNTRIHGIRVQFEFAGMYKYFNMGVLIGTLTSAVVLIQIPAKLVMLLALYCVGLLSKVFVFLHIVVRKFYKCSSSSERPL